MAPGAARLEAGVSIGRTAEDIFAFLAVTENHARFVPGLLEFRKVAPGPAGEVGAAVRAVRRFMGRRVELPYEITEHEPGRRLGMRGRLGPLRFEYGYLLQPVGGGTRVRFRLEMTLTGPAKLAAPLVLLVGRIHAAETLAGLKKALETGA